MSIKHLIPTLLATLLMVQVAQAEPVNINTADATALAKALNGIGPAKAKAIVSYREKNGPFKNVEQLAMVEGITQKLIDKNRADIRFGGDKGAEKGAEKAGTPAPAAKPAKPAS
jgi:competence protein ComEA